MKKISFISLVAICLSMALASCSENDHLIYEEKAKAYFSTLTNEDSISYSFASGAVNEDIVEVPIKIIGEKIDRERSVSISVDPASTAQQGVHYSDLTTSVVIKPGEVTANATLKVYDKQLENGDVSLILNIIPNSDFDSGYTDRQKAKLIITNQLVKPSYWNMPLSLYYGTYSKAKHRLCIQIQGFDFPKELDFNMISDFMSYGRMVYNYILKTPIWDEDTKQWVTADWSPM